MSFRKRNVKPNLNLSKRSLPGTPEPKVENEVGSVPDDLNTLQEGDSVSAPEPIETLALDLTPSAAKEEAKELINTEGLGNSPSASTEELCNIPSASKRLSKRMKVAPKVSQRKSTSKPGIDDACMPPPVRSQTLSPTLGNQKVDDSTPVSSSTPVRSQTFSSTSDNQKVDDCPLVSSSLPCNACIDDINAGEESSPGQSSVVLINTDVIKAYNLIRDGGNMAELNKEIDKNKSRLICPVGTDNKNTDCSISTDNSKAETAKGNRLSKRTRIMPKLTPKSLHQESKNNVSKEVESVTIASDILQTDCPILSAGTDSKLPVKDNIKCDETVRKISCLQKRVKVRPNLKSRINVTSPVDNKRLESDKCLENKNINTKTAELISENECMNLGAEDLAYPLLSSISQERECTNELTQSEFGENISSVDIHEPSSSTASRIIHEEALSIDDNSSSINFDRSSNDSMDKKEFKQVRFTSSDIGANYDLADNQSNDTNISETSHELGCESEGAIPLKEAPVKENANARYDSNDDYDSMSDGETLGKQLESKNKVFKPNLGAKRRERLSSFSAYSSCDEEDWSNQKRRKKDKTKKKAKEGLEKDNVETEEKKRMPRNAMKPKKDRENLEPNAGKAETRRKRKDKPPASKTNKSEKHVERDRSTLTMQELIHYNDPSFKTVELRAKREDDENERVIDLGHSAPSPSEHKPGVDKKADAAAVVAPQIMINEDGEIVINQESLTISQTVDDSALKKSAVVYEDSLSYGNHLKRKHNIGKRWKIDETLRFYKALSEIGTDFTLMSQAFGRFSRNELKKKFKKEEKVNCDLVDRALSNRLPLNMEMFLQGKEEMKDRLDKENSGDEIIHGDTEIEKAGEDILHDNPDKGKTDETILPDCMPDGDNILVDHPDREKADDILSDDGVPEQPGTENADDDEIPENPTTGEFIDMITPDDHDREMTGSLEGEVRDTGREI